MSAETRPDGYVVEDYYLGKFAKLIATAVDLMMKGARTRAMVEELVRAFQLFKENKLGRVREKEPNQASPIERRNGSASLKEKYQASHVANRETEEWVYQTIKGFMESGAVNSTPEIKAAAFWAYHNRPDHQCYRNDSFALAVLCELDFSSQRTAARWALDNARISYWEWTTHAEYDMADALKKLGIVPKDFKAPPKPHGYSDLDDKIVKKLMEYYELTEVGFQP